MEKLGSKSAPMWDAGAVGSSFTCYTTTPAPGAIFSLRCDEMLKIHIRKGICGIIWPSPSFTVDRVGLEST